MHYRVGLAATILGALLCLEPAPARAEVSVSIQVTLAGVAVGGVAWALSLGWSNQLLPALSAPLAAVPDGAERDGPEGFHPLLYLPLLVLPLP